MKRKKWYKVLKTIYRKKTSPARLVMNVLFVELPEGVLLIWDEENDKQLKESTDKWYQRAWQVINNIQ